VSDMLLNNLSTSVGIFRRAHFSAISVLVHRQNAAKWPFFAFICKSMALMCFWFACFGGFLTMA
jgi:hypothetical protein